MFEPDQLPCDNVFEKSLIHSTVKLWNIQLVKLNIMKIDTGVELAFDVNKC